MIETDLISRQQAIDAIKTWGLVDGLSEGQAIEILSDENKVPSAQPERKKGKWLPDTTNYYEERFVCSVCGRSYKVDTCMGKPMWDFCPCGADMRGDKHE